MKKTISIIMMAVMCLSLGACGGSSTGNIAEEKEKYVYDEKFANNNGAYVAGDCVYCEKNGEFYRVNPETTAAERISSCYSIIAVDDEVIYYSKWGDDAYYLYKLLNESDEPESLYKMEKGAKYFLDGEYIYTVNEKGSVIRNINSAEEYEESEQIIYKGFENDVSKSDVKLYNNHIYYLNDDNSVIVEISMEDGGYREIELQNYVSGGFCFYNNNIIYYDNQNGFRKVSINGESDIIYENTKAGAYPDWYYVVNGYLYGFRYEFDGTETFSECFKLDLSKNGNDAYTKIENTDMERFISPLQSGEICGDIGTGILCHGTNYEYFVFDYDGNRIS